jgi:uncharacterized protein YegJ (DUF2314 family)
MRLEAAAQEAGGFRRLSGDQVEFKQADISDWMLMRNDKIVGGVTSIRC